MGKNLFGLKVLLVLGDGAVMYASLFVTLLARHRPDQITLFLRAFLVVYIVWFCIIALLHLYSPTFLKRPHDFFFSLGIFSAVALVMSVLYFYFRDVPNLSPKTILVLHIIFFDILFVMWRLVMHTVMEFLHLLPSDAGSSNDAYERTERKVPLNHVNEAWILKNISLTQSIWFRGVKRIIDIAVALAGLAVTAIIFPFAAFFIIIDSPGSVFYRQERVGRDGRIFILYKFRTMHEEGQQLQLWREKNADAITRVGRILRRLHIDELPQAWSMLKGDISFVGPRPEWLPLAKMFEEQIPFYHQRYVVKPGIIGWAQINIAPSRSVPEAAEKFTYDLYYIKNRSLFLDLEIILKAIKLFLW